MARSGGTSKPQRSFDRICRSLLGRHRSTSKMLGFSSTIASSVQLSSSIVIGLMVASTLTHTHTQVGIAQSLGPLVTRNLGRNLPEVVRNFE